MVSIIKKNNQQGLETLKKQNLPRMSGKGLQKQVNNLKTHDQTNTAWKLPRHTTEDGRCGDIAGISTKSVMT